MPQDAISLYYSKCLISNHRRGRFDFAQGILGSPKGGALLTYRRDAYQLAVSPIETEALSYNRLFCYRRFTIYDEAGQELIHMMATFVLMDRDSRKVHA